ncbi:SHS2 domain-containing protein [Anaerobium acetethylicum]|uniref:SHS2 domain-containing protein n=2 Tax=Anaerobium acetethylicum TaxID=1619234 RepID=A0A1D3TUD5_9FIRM|nr:SHS2 domain-containing protein [Anaerobium acetethylicum]
MDMHRYDFLKHKCDIRLKAEADSLEGLFYAALEGMNSVLAAENGSLPEASIHSRPGANAQILPEASVHNLPGASAQTLPTENREKLNLNIDSADTTALLIDFLSEVLTESNIEYRIFDKLELQELKENHLTAVLYGKSVDRFDTDIKAVTYHEADVKINRKGYYETVIVFDI